ncbi:Torsin-1A-interacting protein 2 [Exaiptasia diaphana]|nr:Torsin-1A-interacting protein 2 [Exaiptasia diaphana]
MRASPIRMSGKGKQRKGKKKESPKTKENVEGYRDHDSCGDDTIEVEDSSETDIVYDSNNDKQKENTDDHAKRRSKSTKLQDDSRLQTPQQTTSGSLIKQPTLKEGKNVPKRATKTDNIPVKRSVLCTVFGYAISGISVVALAVFIAYYWPEEIRPGFLDMTNSDDNFNYKKIFENRIKEIQELFPNQTERFWKIVRSRGLAHLRNKKPSQPLVFLLGAPPSAHAVVDCLAKKLAWCLDPNVSPSNFIDGAKYHKDDGDDTKKILDDELMDIFKKGVRSALVMHLEQLPPPSPLLFYKYCDNDEAPYKHAGIIFTVYLPQEPNVSLLPVEAEGTIETFLSDVAWSKYPYESDSISALLSRIADTVALHTFICLITTDGKAPGKQKDYICFTEDSSAIPNNLGI